MARTGRVRVDANTRRAEHNGGVTEVSVEELEAIGLEHGLDAVGVAAAEVFESTRADLHSRKAAGLSADMQFTYRNPDRSSDPTRALPGAQSLLVGARSYLRDPVGNEIDGPAGAVARYVWEDHYAQLRLALDAMASLLKESGHRARVLADDNAMVDREAAYRAGLGWYGKNSNLLMPNRGSWFVLGSVVTDVWLPRNEPLADGCGTCDRCIGSCPTDAIVAPGVVDANRCLAWLLQAKGTFPLEFRAALGTRIYGCDDCQEVCPPNRLSARRPVELTLPGRRAHVPLLELLEATDEDLLRDYGVWYIPGREPRYLRRNALIGIANTGTGDDSRVVTAVRAMLNSADPMLRAHAVWAAKRLGLDGLTERLANDPAAEVQTELAYDVLSAPPSVTMSSDASSSGH